MKLYSILTTFFLVSNTFASNVDISSSKLIINWNKNYNKETNIKKETLIEDKIVEIMKKITILENKMNNFEEVKILTKIKDNLTKKYLIHKEDLLESNENINEVININ